MIRRDTRTAVQLGVLSLATVLIGACGSGSTRQGPIHPGRVECHPSIECLPDPDVEDSDLTERMRIGQHLAADSFEVPPPPAPPDGDAVDLQGWSSTVLATWLERKQHTVQLAREELDRAAEENHRQRIIGGALVGMMYEDIGMVIRAIPAPAELAGEPEFLALFQRVLDSQAAPFLAVSRAAYRACARNAVRPAGMRHWSRFCAGRQDRLPEEDPLAGDQPRSGETVVDVIAD